MMREACGGLDVVSRDDVTRFTQNLYEWVEGWILKEITSSASLAAAN